MTDTDAYMHLPVGYAVANPEIEDSGVQRLSTNRGKSSRLPASWPW
jgi:hypothetical protein